MTQGDLLLTAYSTEQKRTASYVSIEVFFANIAGLFICVDQTFKHTLTIGVGMLVLEPLE